MKKDFIFAPAMLIIGALLFMLRTTGMEAHIAISVLGVIMIVVSRNAGKRSDKPLLKWLWQN